MNVAKWLRAKIFTKEQLIKYGNNQNICNGLKHEKRSDYEGKLSFLMKSKYVKTFDKLKEAIEKL